MPKNAGQSHTAITHLSTKLNVSLCLSIYVVSLHLIQIELNYQKS